MKIERFEERQIVWQKAQKLALNVYKLFRINKDFGFKEQMQRAAMPISNNIAVGFERRGNKELKYFLFVAKGSTAEVRNMIYIANELQYIKKDEFDTLLELTLEISIMLLGLIKKL